MFSLLQEKRTFHRNGNSQIHSIMNGTKNTSLPMTNDRYDVILKCFDGFPFPEKSSFRIWFNCSKKFWACVGCQYQNFCSDKLVSGKFHTAVRMQLLKTLKTRNIVFRRADTTHGSQDKCAEKICKVQSHYLCHVKLSPILCWSPSTACEDTYIRRHIIYSL